MSDSGFLLIIGSLVTIHLVVACPVLFFLLRRIKYLRLAKLPKKYKQRVEIMHNYFGIVALLPIAGPIIGVALLNGAKLGVPEKGYKVNDPGGQDFTSGGGD